MCQCKEIAALSNIPMAPLFIFLFIYLFIFHFFFFHFYYRLSIYPVKMFCDSVTNADLFQNQESSFYMLFISF